jgi:hypothetical protein
MNVENFLITVKSKLIIKDNTAKGQTVATAYFTASGILPGSTKATPLTCIGKLIDHVPASIANLIEDGRNFLATGTVVKSIQGNLVLAISSIELPAKNINRSVVMKKDTPPHGYQTTEPGM